MVVQYCVCSHSQTFRPVNSILHNMLFWWGSGKLLLNQSITSKYKHFCSLSQQLRKGDIGLSVRLG